MKLSHLSSRRQIQGLKKKVLSSLNVLDDFHVTVSKKALDDPRSYAKVDHVNKELVQNQRLNGWRPG
jgi:hypothetical protein